MFHDLERVPVYIDDIDLIIFLKGIKDELFSNDRRIRYHAEAIVEGPDQTSVDMYWLQLVIQKVLSQGGIGDTLFDFSKSKGFEKRNFSTKTLTDLVDSQIDSAAIPGGVVY